MNKIHAVILFALSLNAVANEVDDFKNQYKLLDNEIRIVKMSDFMKSSIKNDKDSREIMSSVLEMKKTKMEMDKQGYVLKKNPSVRFLLHQMKDEKFRDFVKTHSHEFSDTLDGVQIAYGYKEINPSYYDAHWGYSPMGVYRTLDQGYEKEGWTGIVEVFEKEGLSCSYTEHNTKLAHGGNELIEEFITHHINNKPTIELVSGDAEGFGYKISWFQKDFDKTLECASFDYSQKTLEKVRSFAKEIDNR